MEISTPATRHPDRRFLREGEVLIADVSRITRDNDGCFRWSLTKTEGSDEGTTHYRTSDHGDGAWVLTTKHCACLGCDGHSWIEWKQVLGTSQFDLRGVSAQTRRRRVVRAFAVCVGW